MDSEAFMAGLSERDKVIIQFIVQGKPLAILARRRHLNSSTMLYHKERLALKIQNFMGPQILVDILQRPSWKDCINSTREKTACREERRHL
jgi:FixJ family two-component response regulator